MIKLTHMLKEGGSRNIGYAKFIFSLQTLISDLAPNAWEDKSQIDSTSMKRIHNSLKKRYGSDYKKYNALLKTQKGQFGNWYLKEGHLVKEVSPSRVKYKVGEKVKVKDGFPKYGGMEAKIVGYDKSNNNKNSFELLFKGKGKVSWFIPTDLRKLDESINEGPSVISMKESEKVWDALVKKFSDNKNDSIEYLNKDKSYRNMAIKAIFTATKF